MWTDKYRAAYMASILGRLTIGGTWGMTMGIWHRVGERRATLTPIVSRSHPDAVDMCLSYADDARRAGYEVELLKAETVAPPDTKEG